MKEFEKWKNNDKLLQDMKKRYLQAAIGRVTWDSLEEVMEYTWKKALEIISKHINDNGCYYSGLISEINGIINEELEEE